MRIFIIGLMGVFLLTGCNLFRDPQLIYTQGNYYIAGDDKCVHYMVDVSGIEEPLEKPNQILCYDVDKKPVEIRSALTELELYEWQYARAKADAEQQVASQNRKTNNKAFFNSMMGVINQNNANMQDAIQSGSTYQSPSSSPSAGPYNNVETNPTYFIPGECSGTTTNNKCNGVFIPNSSSTKICYGPIVNGECRGAFY